MKAVIIVYLSLLSISLGSELVPSIDTDKNVIIRMSSEGEDATSTFYTFAYSLKKEDTEFLYKLRCLWNGGATNQPTTSDYYLEDDGGVMMVDRTYDRGDLQALLEGKSPVGKVTKRVRFNINGKLSESERKAFRELYGFMRTTRGMKQIKPKKQIEQE